MPVTCAFCPATVADMDAAAAAGWEPSHYSTPDTMTSADGGPVCPACQQTRLTYDEDGEPIANVPDPERPGCWITHPGLWP